MRLLQAILGVVGLAPQLPDPPQPYLSLDHPASFQFSTWLTAFNTGDRESITAYHTDLTFPLSAWPIGFPGSDGIDRVIEFSRMMGGFDVAKVESTDDSFVVVVLKEQKNHMQHFRVNMSVDVSRPTYPVTKFSFMPIVTPLDLIPEDDSLRPEYEKALKPLTASRRQAVIDGFLDVLHEQYVDPKVGEDIQAMLEANIKNGEYDDIEDNTKFAYRLSHDLRSYEKRMFVAFFEPRPELKDSDAGPTPKTRLEELRIMNFGFGKTSFDTESVPGHTIATLRINAFIPVDERWETESGEIRAAVGDTLSSVADADALIIDLRYNHGGDPHTVSFIESYLLDNGPLHTLNMITRNGSAQNSYFTLAVDQLPPGSKRFGGTKPLFVLTSNFTFTGGEDLVYTLQAFNRAQAIIGEGNDATSGVANPVTQTHFVAEETFGKRWWFVEVPTFRPVHTVTASNWGGVGIKSDVVAGKGEWTDVKDAKEVARLLAVQTLQQDKEL